MSDSGTAASPAAAFLASVPLLEGMPHAELEELGRLMPRRDVRAGEVL